MGRFASVANANALRDKYLWVADANALRGRYSAITLVFPATRISIAGPAQMCAKVILAATTGHVIARAPLVSAVV
jgi:hypothetical protein